jgi:hypothetical protein
MPTKLSFTLIAILFLQLAIIIIYNFLHEFLDLFLDFMLVLIIKIYCFLRSLRFIVVDFLILRFFIFLILSVLIDHSTKILIMNISLFVLKFQVRCYLSFFLAFILFYFNPNLISLIFLIIIKSQDQLI